MNEDIKVISFSHICKQCFQYRPDRCVIKSDHSFVHIYKVSEYDSYIKGDSGFIRGGRSKVRRQSDNIKGHYT